MMLLILLFAWSNVGILTQANDAPGGDNLSPTDDAIFVGAGVALYPILLSLLLVLGMSIFTRVVVYQGGRYQERRFYDRIIELANASRGHGLKTALMRAVFCFPFVGCRPGPAGSRPAGRQLSFGE